jgi:hypothetical protein
VAGECGHPGSLAGEPVRECPPPGAKPGPGFPCRPGPSSRRDGPRRGSPPWADVTWLACRPGGSNPVVRRSHGHAGAGAGAPGALLTWGWGIPRRCLQPAAHALPSPTRATAGGAHTGPMGRGEIRRRLLVARRRHANGQRSGSLAGTWGGPKPAGRPGDWRQRLRPACRELTGTIRGRVLDAQVEKVLRES